MPKSIKVQQLTYDHLESLREKRESFSETIDRLIKAYVFLQTINQPRKRNEN